MHWIVEGRKMVPNKFDFQDCDSLKPFFLQPTLLCCEAG